MDHPVLAALRRYRLEHPGEARQFDADVAELGRLVDEAFRCPHCGKRRDGN